MKIQSSFRDYYDRCQGFGTDDIVYMRYSSSQVIKDMKLIFKMYIEHDIICEITYIGFCGKIYPSVEFWYKYHNSIGYINGGFFYSVESLDKFVKTLHSTIQSDYFNTKFIPRYNNRNSLKRIFDTKIENIYSEEPVFIISSEDSYDKQTNKDRHIVNLSLNDKLSYYNFAKLFPPNLAYQEIHSFLNNKAIPIKPLPQLDDKTMAEIKGFDKWSFKKEPTTTKNKR